MLYTAEKVVTGVLVAAVLIGFLGVLLLSVLFAELRSLLKHPGEHNE